MCLVIAANSPIMLVIGPCTCVQYQESPVHAVRGMLQRHVHLLVAHKIGARCNRIRGCDKANRTTCSSTQ